MTDMNDIEAVTTTLRVLEAQLEALWGPRDDPLPLDDLAMLLIALTDFQKALATHVASVEETIVNVMPEKTAQTHWATLEVKTSANKTTWDSELLMPKVAQAAMESRSVDPDTGEIESSSTAIVKAVLECAAISYWRLGKLSELEIDGTKYRSTEWGRKRIKVTNRVSSPDPAPDVG